MPRRQVSKDDIRAYYASTLRDYELIWFAGGSLSMHFGYQENHDTSHAESLVDANRVLADLATISPGDRVLDAGCGLGGTSVWLAEATHARVTGIALGSDQIHYATREAARRAVRLR